MYFSLLIEGAPFVGHDANDHNLLLKGAPFYNAITAVENSPRFSRIFFLTHTRLREHNLTVRFARSSFQPSPRLVANRREQISLTAIRAWAERIQSVKNRVAIRTIAHVCL